MTREANNNSRVRAYDAKHSMFLFLSELHFHSISGSTSTDPTQQDKSSGNEDMRVGRRAGKARQCKAANLGLDAEELAAAGDGPERENHRRRGFQESWRGGSRRRGRHWGAATHEEEAVDKRDGRAAREQGGAGQSTLVREKIRRTALLQIHSTSQSKILQRCVCFQHVLYYGGFAGVALSGSAQQTQYQAHCLVR
jgi:hypothetical protein